MCKVWVVTLLTSDEWTPIVNWVYASGLDAIGKYGDLLKMYTDEQVFIAEVEIVERGENIGVYL